ncbi:DUF7674 family protein [Alcanivorax sp.]|uniref:DUF7674 family protein n=1 Tax=Alcanivorax sp. TaxID=1872427 RepID=UPI003BACFF2A
MALNGLYNNFRAEFPEITRLTDLEHIQEWGSVDPEMAFSWFESLARFINREMSKGVSVKPYIPVFEFLRRGFMLGNDDEKKCIDVSFVENLFWGVDKEKRDSYWRAFPDVLKGLYVSFHGREPA